MMLAIALTLSLAQAPRGSFELTAYPVVPQLNVLDSEHVGTMGQVAWRPQERFAIVVFGGRNWSSSNSKLNDELIAKSRVEVRAAARRCGRGGSSGASSSRRLPPNSPSQTAFAPRWTSW